MVILVDLHLCSSGSDACSSGCEVFQESRVFVDLELIVRTSNYNFCRKQMYQEQELYSLLEWIRFRYL
jgi:hypothetical protein